jgi:hypothetical protein
LHLVVGENHGQKPPAVARALTRLKYPRRRCAAMVAIGNVEKWDSGKLRFDEFDPVRIGDPP